VVGSVGRASVQLPVGQHAWRLAVISAAGEVAWEGRAEGERARLRTLHVPEAALRSKHVVALEAACEFGDCAVAVRTRVSKSHLTCALL